MFVVRPVARSDIPSLEAFSSESARTVHTLPRTRKTIEEAVERSMASFSCSPDIPECESYVFVLESRSDRSVVGTAAIAATAGAGGTFFSFRNDLINQVSRELNISSDVQALTLCTDLTNHSQLSAFYVNAHTEARAHAALLSRARIMFVAVAAYRFREKLCCSMSGVTDSEGHSPFWDALGRKFFQMDFLDAERLIEGARNRTLIVELMPPYPVYVPLLPRQAQAVIGKVHPDRQLPFQILSSEGFECEQYIDIFDGAPILQAHRSVLRSYADSVRCTVVTESEHDAGSLRHACMIATAREENFRVVLAHCAVPEPTTGNIVLTSDVMESLGITVGDHVLWAKM